MIEIFVFIVWCMFMGARIYFGHPTALKEWIYQLVPANVHNVMFTRQRLVKISYCTLVPPSQSIWYGFWQLSAEWIFSFVCAWPVCMLYDDGVDDGGHAINNFMSTIPLDESQFILIINMGHWNHVHLITHAVTIIIRRWFIFHQKFVSWCLDLWTSSSGDTSAFGPLQIREKKKTITITEKCQARRKKNG